MAMTTRRQFLLRSAGFGFGAIAPIGLQSWAARAAIANPSQKRMIIVLLRGAIDGLNVVVPYSDRAYYAARPTIAIPAPGQKGGALKLDAQFGLHPALSPLMPLWSEGSLAFVHACGSPDATRSHFDAQDYLETATPGKKSTVDGWMNRLLSHLAGRNPVQAVNVGTTTPRILTGTMAVANLPSGRGAIRQIPIDRPGVSNAFDRLYGGNGELSTAYREGREARKVLMADLDAEMQQANNGAPLPNGFVSDAQRLAKVMARDGKVQLGFLAVGGWDTHVNQGSSAGTFARNLTLLGQGLLELQKGLGAAYRDTAIVVMSEFGRTVQENGNRGTDHGHGNVMWLLGGAIDGGRVYGDFPGLATSALYQNRDLAITTDFRDVIGSVIQAQFKLNPDQLAQVIPNYSLAMTKFLRS
jgi:uncharacterized protein (DUF1501 family)